ncbi:MAG: alpha/beta hydrolase [Planctomycetes bacterium]|nr:alpha/beta hydrolase [Planctomycetota bacterium]
MTQPAQKSKLGKWLRRFAAATLLLIVASWLISAWVFAHQMTRRRSPLFAENVPALAWGSVEAFRLDTLDGQHLGAWLVPGRTDKSAVLLLHGIGANRSSCLREAQMLATAGHPVLLITLRAHGDSTGDENDFGYSARHDVAAAVAWWKQQHPNQPLVVWGQSLGAAAAIFAAGDLGHKVQGYVLECPYQDLHTATRNRTRLMLPEGVELVAYCGLRCVAPLVLSDASKISPYDAATGIPDSIPVLILAGGQDPYARPEEAQAIHERIKAHCTLALFEQAGHMQLAKADPGRYSTTVLEFVDACGKTRE